MDKKILPSVVYRVKQWNTFFETTNTQKQRKRTSCIIPNKQGLGYYRLLMDPNGEALFGAWCSLIQYLSRHDPPRQGWLTHTGKPPSEGGQPLTAGDIAMLTRFTESTVENMLRACASVEIGWLEIVEPQDRPEQPDEPVQTSGEAAPSDTVNSTGPDKTEKDVILTFETVGSTPTWNLTNQKIGEWIEAYPGVDVMREIKKARQWLRDNPTRRKTARGMPRFLNSWLSRAQDRRAGGITTRKFLNP